VPPVVGTLDLPGETHAAFGHGENAVFRRVGRQLVQHQADRQRLPRFQPDCHTLELDRFGTFRRERLERPGERAHVGALPVALEQQVVRSRERVHPPEQNLSVLLG
jgi:hypothetical protein